jgi:hypothetical protein
MAKKSVYLETGKVKASIEVGAKWLNLTIMIPPNVRSRLLHQLKKSESK